jgi:ribonuclease HII
MTPRFDPALLPACPHLDFEQEIWAQGLTTVAGVDEAGRGPLAGPVCAAAVVLPPRADLSSILSGVNDSKQMTAEARLYWAAQIRAAAMYWGAGFASAEEIDEKGIVPAIQLAVERALAQLPCPPQHLLLDHMSLPNAPCPQTALVKGDARSLSVAAASVLAKTARDGVMCELDLRYPGYGFAANKGYGTPFHLKALAELGPSPVHRRSFRSVIQDRLEKDEI